MKTTYCTSCGAETTKRICRSCGVKQDIVHKFCKCCGQPLPEKASVCVNCKEKVKKDSFFWSVLNVLFAIIPLSMLILSASESQPAGVLIFFALSFLLCLPLSRRIINKNTLGNRRLRTILKLARILLVIVFFALGMYLIPVAEPVVLTTDEAYAQFIDRSEQGYYEEARLLAINYPEIKEMPYVEDYLTYGEALKAYDANAIGYAYNQLLTIPDTLDAQKFITEIENEIGYLEGLFIEDNGRGAYLYLLIEDGKAYTKVVGYNDYTGDHNIDMYAGSSNYLLKGSFTTGEMYYAIGDYHTYQTELKEDYIMTIFENGDEIMMLAPEGAEFRDFNGLYERIQ